MYYICLYAILKYIFKTKQNLKIFKTKEGAIIAKILIIDDSALSRRMLRAILEAAGYSVVEAENGISGIKKFFSDKPDVVLLDLTMEGMPGMEVLRKLKDMDKSARVVIASADIQTSTQKEAIEAGAESYLTKPYTPEQVIKVVKGILEGTNHDN